MHVQATLRDVNPDKNTLQCHHPIPFLPAGESPSNCAGVRMKGGAGALLDTGQTTTIAYGRSAAAAHDLALALRYDAHYDPDPADKIASLRSQ